MSWPKFALFIFFLPGILGLENTLFKVKIKFYRTSQPHSIESVHCHPACNPFFNVRMLNTTFSFGGDHRGYKGRDFIVFHEYLSPTLRNELTFRGEYSKFFTPKPIVYVSIGNEHRGKRVYGIKDGAVELTTKAQLPRNLPDGQWSTGKAGFIATNSTIFLFKYEAFCMADAVELHCFDPITLKQTVPPSIQGGTTPTEGLD
ncbi:unnamed protein product [Calicophoron daubneyi]|uniref:Uncharacterized protein n=1 Tax=Calicophoron daubneyi TaxID=300641 RepID=A0AAV2T5M3_CALDB